jgi:hypothetical protein
MRFASYIAVGLIIAAILSAQTGNRKVTENAKSPTADTSITLDGHAITIEYNAPSARGRKVEGGLIPYDTWWRLGADNATTLTTDADLVIGNLRVPKGACTLYVLASESGVSRFTPLAVVTRWTLIVNKQVGQWGTVYDDAQDLGRTAMKVTKPGQPVETLKIVLIDSGAKSAKLRIEWGNSRAEVPVKLR